MRQWTGYILYNFDIVCKESGFLWPIGLNYLALHIDTWVYSRYDQINLETVQKQVKIIQFNFPIEFLRTLNVIQATLFEANFSLTAREYWSSYV